MHGIPENALPELTIIAPFISYCIPNEPLEHVTHIIQRFVILLYDRTSKCADYGSYRSASVHIQPQLVVQELLTVAASIHGFPDPLCCSRVALIGEICRFHCENFFVRFCQCASLLCARRMHLNTQHCV